MHNTLSHSTIDWGRTHHEQAFKRQLELVEKRRTGELNDTLIFTEHHPVYTIGVRKGAQDHLIWKEKTLRDQGISVVRTNRGGDITYHGPGQIVGYPIISLERNKDLHVYIRNLEQVLIQSLGHLGLVAQRREGKTGIWLQDRKIAAIGITARGWITYHGFALNVNNDLTPFQGIVPCGIQPTEGSVTSIKIELGREIEIDEVKSMIAIEFWNIFSKSYQ